MKSNILLFILILGIFLVSSCAKKEVQEPIGKELPDDYLLTYSEGNCLTTSECSYAGEGCGGGHGICTNNPEKYEGAVTTCDIVPSHPINQGYGCVCIGALGKCGWVQVTRQNIKS